MQSLSLQAFGGMDDRWIAPMGTAEYIKNMRADETGVWTRSGGAVRLSETASSGKVTSIGWFSQHDGARQWIVYEAVGPSSATYDLTAWNGATLLSLAASRATVGVVDMPSQYVTAGNWLYVVNGRDAPVRWDGHEVVQVGFEAAPRAPNLEVIEQVDLWPQDVTGYTAGVNATHQRGVGPQLSSGTGQFKYVYAFAWVNDLGMRSPLSARATITGTNAAATGKYYVRVAIPEAPPQARGFIVYRSENINDITLVDAQNVNLYHHSSYEFAFQCALLDGTPDNELGSLVDYVDLIGLPPRARLAAVFQNQMYLASSDRLYRSLPLRLEEFPEDHVMRVGNRDSGEITALYATRNALLVFKRRAIYMIRGSGDGVQIQTLTETSGCSSPNGVVEVPGLGVMFLDEDGPKVLGGSPDEAGELATIEPMPGIRKVWRRRANTSALVAAVSCLNWSDREVWFQIPADGDDRPSLGLVYHLNNGAWSLREGYTASCFTVTRDHRNYVLYGSWGTSAQSGVFVYSHGQAAAAGTTIVPMWRSSWVTSTDPTKFWVPRALNVVALANARDLTLNHRANRSVSYDNTTAVSFPAKDTEIPDPPVWGTAQWSLTELWSDLGTVPVQMPVVIGAGKVREAQVELSGSRPALVGASFDVGPASDDQRITRQVYTGGPV